VRRPSPGTSLPLREARAGGGPSVTHRPTRTPARRGSAGASGAYRGFGYRYVMPQVDAWVNAAGPDAEPVFRGTSYLSRTNRRDRAGELIAATPDASPTGSLRATATRPAGIGPEDLSFTPADNRLWTVTEFAGRRMLYGVRR